MWFNKEAEFIYNYLPPPALKSTPQCHIDIGCAGKVDYATSCQLFLSPIQSKDQTNATLESNRFLKLMERFIPQSRPQWKRLPSMEKSVCQHVVH